MEVIKIPRIDDGGSGLTSSHVTSSSSARRRSGQVMSRPRRCQQSSYSPSPQHSDFSTNEIVEDSSDRLSPSESSDVVSCSSSSNATACISTRHRSSQRHPVKHRRVSRTTRKSLGTPPLVKKIITPPSFVAEDTSSSSSSCSPEAVPMEGAAAAPPTPLLYLERHSQPQEQQEKHIPRRSAGRTKTPPSARAVTTPTLAGATLLVNIIQGRDLVAKDRNLLGMRTSSDPYVQVYLFDSGWHNQGQTARVSKSLSPVWDETITISLGADAARALFKSGEPLELRLYDYDMLSEHDYMGSVTVPILPPTSSALTSSPSPQWHRVQKRSPNHHDLICHDASGEVQVLVTVQAEPVVDLRVGDVYAVPPRCTEMDDNNKKEDKDEQNETLSIGMAWGPPLQNAVGHDVVPSLEVESYCVAMNGKGEVVLDECLYYNHWNNANRSLIHNRDDTTGGKTRELHYYHFDNHVMRMQLDKIPSHVVALFVVLAIHDPADKDQKSCIQQLQKIQVRCVNAATKKALFRYVPSSLGTEEDTAMILWRLARDAASPSTSSSSSWNVVPLGMTCPISRDFGSLLPTLKVCMSDMVPKIQIGSKGDRIAVMHPQQPIRVIDYVRSATSLPSRLMARAVLLLDAKGNQLNQQQLQPITIMAILMDQAGHKTDVINQGHGQSRDQATQWEVQRLREGSSTTFTMETPCIVLNLPRVSKRTQSIGFVIAPAATGQGSSTTTTTTCEKALFILEEEAYDKEDSSSSPSSSRSVVAHFAVSLPPMETPPDKKESGLLVACLHRDENSDEDRDKDVDVQHQQNGHAWNLRVLPHPIVGEHESDYANAWRDWLRSHPSPVRPIRLPAVPATLTPPPLNDLIPVQPSTNRALIPVDQLSEYLL